MSTLYTCIDVNTLSYTVVSFILVCIQHSNANNILLAVHKLVHALLYMYIGYSTVKWNHNSENIEKVEQHLQMKFCYKYKCTFYLLH